MFDALKNMGSMAGILKDLPRIKAKMEEVKAKLGDVIVEAETGGGAVRVRANGHLRVVSVEVDHALLSTLVDTSDPDDLAMAQDLITGAVNAALEKARDVAQREVSEAAGDLGLPIPPGLGDLMT